MLCNKCGHSRDCHTNGAHCSRCGCRSFVPPGDADAYEDSFEETVRKMREAQRLYFATRSSESLIESKQLEKEVDRMLEERFNKQGRMFG